MTFNRIAVLTTHPIQYQAPWFRELSAHPQIELEVFFCHRATPKEQAAAGFGVEFDWDVSLLDGYSYRFLKNVAPQPRVNGFGGLDTPEIKEIISRQRFDAVIVNGWHYKSAWQTMRACQRTGTPVMVRSDSHLKTERSLAKQAAKWPFYRWFIPKLDACLAVGQWSRDYFLHYGAPPDRIFVVPHVVDIDYLRGEADKLRPQRHALRANWGLDSDSVVFLFAGKFTEIKRPLEFVQAVGDAARHGRRVKGLMAGDGPLRPSCEAFAQTNCFPISFTGFLNQSQIARAYVASDVLVLPSTTETWGLVVNEAMALGLPCFVSDRVGCGPDMVARDKTGAVFRVGDQKELGELLSTYAASPDKLSRMREHARHKAQEYTVSVAVEGVLRALDAVSGKGQKRSAKG